MDERTIIAGFNKTESLHLEEEEIEDKEEEEDTVNHFRRYSRRHFISHNALYQFFTKPVGKKTKLAHSIALLAVNTT